MRSLRIMVTAALFVGSTGLWAGCEAEDATAGKSSAEVISDGNDTLESADPMAIDSDVEGKLSRVGDLDFYSFEGKAGQVIRIDIDAEILGGVRFDNDYIDTWVTLLDAQGKRLAENDDEIPLYDADSHLITRLPGDGTYFVRVADCWDAAEDPEEQCAWPKKKSVTKYTMYLYEVDPALKSVTFDTEAGNDWTSADAIGYEISDNGYPYLSDLVGTFTDAADVDVFSFEMPESIPIEYGKRSVGYFWVLPGGDRGTGSTAGVGRAYITDEADPSVVLAEIHPRDDGAVELSPPLALGKKYLLFITPPEDVGGSNDFYVVRHFAGQSNPLEKEEVPNDTVDKAELITQKDENDSDQEIHKYIEGDLPAGESAVDHFKVKVPSKFQGVGTVSVACAAQRVGSGVRHFNISLLFLKEDGSPINVGSTSAMETSLEDLFMQNALIPAGAEHLVLKFETGQDPNVASAFYRCGLHLRL
ncbi:MAG TPA: PPC domain-containing protein [Polyangiaceae bacterium]|nr:PPC domain-containing protein [Polyangiaceae bacterium]